MPNIISVLSYGIISSSIYHILNKGLGFIVGNGKSIRVWDDCWLSPWKPEAPIGPLTLANQNLRVRDLLNAQTNDWDLEKIRLHLPHYEDVIRLNIPSSQGTPDKQVWLPDPSGIYSAKSWYRMIFEEKNTPVANSFDWLKLIWKLHIPPKLQHFLWVALNNALPVGTLLATRGVLTELSCKRCGEQETITHVFFSCPFATEFWT